LSGDDKRKKEGKERGGCVFGGGYELTAGSYAYAP